MLLISNVFEINVSVPGRENKKEGNKNGRNISFWTQKS